MAEYPGAEVTDQALGLGARVLAEFGDDPRRFRDGKSRRYYAGMQVTQSLAYSTHPSTRRV